MMTVPFHHYRRPGPRRTWMLFNLALPGMTALLGGPLFCRLFFFLYGYYQHLFLLLSFLLVRMLLNVCGDIESNPGPGSDKRVRVLYSNIRVFMPIWMNFLSLDRIMMFWFVLSLKSLIAAISQSSVSLALVAPNRG